MRRRFEEQPWGGGGVRPPLLGLFAEESHAHVSQNQAEVQPGR